MCFPGQTYLSRALKVSERTIREYLKELEDTGMIQTVQRGQGKTNEYWIEDLNVIYGDAENPIVPSAESFDMCWPVGANVRREIHVEDEAPTPKAPPLETMVHHSAAMEASKLKSAEDRRKKAEKQQRKDASKVNKQAAKRSREGMSTFAWEHWWGVRYDELFGVDHARWNAADKNKLEKLVDEFGEELVKEVIGDLFGRWEYWAERFSWDLLTIGIVYGYRNTLFTEVRAGRTFDRKQGRKAETKADEYREPETGSKDPGW